MKRCVATRVLSRYLDRELSADGAEHVRRHLAACRNCAARADVHWLAEQAIRRSAPPAGPAPDLAERTVRALRQRGAFLGARLAAGRQRVFGRRRFGRREVTRFALAAAVVLVAVAWLDVVTRLDWRHVPGTPALAGGKAVIIRPVVAEPWTDALAMEARGAPHRPVFGNVDSGVSWAAAEWRDVDHARAVRSDLATLCGAIPLSGRRSASP